MEHQRSNQALERTAARCAFTFQMIKTVSVEAALTLGGGDSETDDLPVGDSRCHWAADALAKKDVEIARCEELYRNAAREAAARLVARFAQ